ncbi:MAG: hypothetical protein OHK93_008442 [Ramalina farinacea]|uniref:Phytanoyl-CoA dioxygenase n=1 Tax=Ramalina farinacea TaxID=258253 RepID=A0AA43TVA3_9LECA|nr:hypothetical protein [Ramalina farinacea]
MSTTTTTTEIIHGQHQKRLTVKGIKGDIDDQHIGRLRPTPKDAPLSELKQQLDEDGYLFIKNLIPRDDVLHVRQKYFEHYSPTGILLPGTNPVDGVFNATTDPAYHAGLGAGNLPSSEDDVEKLISAHVLPDYLKFLDHPDLRAMVRALMNWDREILLRRTLLRHNIPHGLSTGVHYDKLFLRDGGAYFLTAWVPIGDIALNGGGLIYLSDSAGLGREIEDDFTRRAATLPESERVSAFNVNMGQFGQLSDDAGSFHVEWAKGKGKWLVSDFEAGDVVFHDPYTIHGSSRNEDAEGRIRLSTDLRFYEEGSDIDARWMRYWTPGDGL